MANTRVYNAQGLNVNGVAVGGLAQVGVSAAYRDIIRSTADGAYGVEDIDRAGLRVGVTIDCTDVLKANSIMATAELDTTFSGQKSGAATWQDITLKRCKWTGMRLAFNKSSDARLSLTGVLRANAAAQVLKDLVLAANDAAVPTETYPARLFRLYGCTFNAGSAVPIVHVESVQLSLDANVLEDYGDDELAISVVDITHWNPLQVSVGFKDTTESTGSDKAAEMLGYGRGELRVDMLGRAGGANKRLVVGNLLWMGVEKTKGPDHWQFELKGEAAWKDINGAYDINGALKLFQFIAAT